jgi:uncharacterized caspase-like protein
MGHNLAIVVGINEYERLNKLKYARHDALTVKTLLEERGEVSGTLLFTDNSEPIDGKPTRATHTNLRDLLISMFEVPFLHPEDNLWFFFSGHGLRYDQQDYLLPLDANPRDIDGTGITIDFITKRLSKSGAGNIVLILDACRNAKTGGKGVGELGEEAKERVREKGLISIFACRPDEESWEEDALQQGIFTYALANALQEHRCSTVRQINSYLRTEVPALAMRYGKPAQTPWLVAEPIEKADLILVPKNTKEADLDKLKSAALRQEIEENFAVALELWNRVNIAAEGQDREFYAAFERIQRKLQRQLLEVERQQKQENERLEAEQREKDRLEAEQREKNRLEAEQREKDRLEAEQREKNRLEAEQREKNRLEAERREKNRLEAEQREKDRLEAERREKNRLEAEQREKDRLEAEQREKNRLEAEQRERNLLAVKSRRVELKKPLEVQDQEQNGKNQLEPCLECGGVGRHAFYCPLRENATSQLRGAGLIRQVEALFARTQPEKRTRSISAGDIPSDISRKTSEPCPSCGRVGKHDFFCAVKE